MQGIRVSDFFNDKKESLKLEIIAGKKGLERKITTYEINRLGLALAGFLDYFPKERIQIMGLVDHLYLCRLSDDARINILKKIFAYKEIPAVIVAGNFKPHPDVVKICQRNALALFSTSVEPSRLIGEIVFYLEELFSPSVTRHGTLVNVYGLGILIEGESGVGKSECALGLIRRGHRLVADDLVHIRRHSEGVLIGRSHKLIHNYLEVRGLGIIDVSMIFGVGAILDRSNIDMVIKFEDWNRKKNYDRLGLDTLTTEILNISLPMVIIPVKPGRDLPILVEAATLKLHLKNKGINSASILQEKLIKTLSSK